MCPCSLWNSLAQPQAAETRGSGGGSGVPKAAAEAARADAEAGVPRRWPWARLLQRVFGFEVLVCDRCGGRRRILGAVTEPHAVRGSSRRWGWRPSRRRGGPPPPPDPRSVAPPRGAAVPVCSPARGVPGLMSPTSLRLAGPLRRALHSALRNDATPRRDDATLGGHQAVWRGQERAFSLPTFSPRRDGAGSRGLRWPGMACVLGVSLPNADGGADWPTGASTRPATDGLRAGGQVKNSVLAVQAKTTNTPATDP
jgi:hypothetical protein